MEIVTRAEAKRRGLKRYFTGEACKYGHLFERFVGNGDCMGCARTRCLSFYYQHPETAREWRKRNPERLKVYRANDYAKRDRTIWENKNRDRISEYNRKQHYYGPQNPTGDSSWLRKNAAQLRAVRRLLKNMKINPKDAVSQFWTEASALGLTPPT